MTRVKRVRWTDAEILDLENYYPCKPKDWLESYFSRNWKAIKDKANKQGIYRLKGNEGLEVLLDNSLQSLYWIGFLLADGHFSNNQRISVELSSKDKAHLENFANYIGTSNMYSRERSLNNKTYYQNSVTINNIKVVPKIVNIFSISNNKTVNPPNIPNYNITEEQLISLIIGFIDGDGSIYKPTYTEKLRIECHKNWYENLLFFEDLLYKKFKTNKKVNQLTKISSRDTAVLEISSATLLRELKKFITINKIIVMNRKWDLVKSLV